MPSVTARAAFASSLKVHLSAVLSGLRRDRLPAAAPAGCRVYQLRRLPVAVPVCCRVYRLAASGTCARMNAEISAFVTRAKSLMPRKQLSSPPEVTPAIA
jgi:hypothetical protein